MTFLDRLKADHPEIKNDTDRIVRLMCPEDLGYEKRETPCAELETEHYRNACAECWGREIPLQGGEGELSAEDKP